VYLQFFGLTEAPFSITPDPAFVYLSAAHRDALAHLLYGVGKGGAGGFVQLTGEVGTGKTTLCRCLLEQVPDDTIIALILYPMLTPKELLATICQELEISTAGISDSSKALVDVLNNCLLMHHAEGRRVVVVIDEAQNLSPEALEQVRLLTNLETEKHKLLQMVLLGQPELRQLLQRQNLRQLAQRITARYHLAPLDAEETRAYVRHRMQVAGAHHNPFKTSAMRALYQRSGGVPRLINIIADRALAGAYARESESVNASQVHEAANEVQPSETRVKNNASRLWMAVAAVLLLVMGAVVYIGGGAEWPFRINVARETGTEAAPQPVTAVRDSASAVSVPPQSSGNSAETRTDSSTTAQAGPSQIADVSIVEANPPSEPAGSTDALSSSSTGYPAPEVGALTTPAMPEPAIRDTAILDTAWLEAQNEQVWRGMAGLWQQPVHANAIQAACDGQAGTGYACLRDQGSWSRVQKLGLPVILILQGEGMHRVLLRGIEGTGLLLGAGEDSIFVDRAQVVPLWLGEYIVAWPQAPDWPIQIRRGESGAAVDIVMRMATQAEPAWKGGGVFDAGFESWLKTFQERNGLTVDGIIGPKTLLYLMAPTIVEPRLDVEGLASS